MTKRIIGKVDNDFNLSESDWIPRAAAWITVSYTHLDVYKRQLFQLTEAMQTPLMVFIWIGLLTIQLEII